MQATQTDLDKVTELACEFLEKVHNRPADQELARNILELCLDEGVIFFTENSFLAAMPWFDPFTGRDGVREVAWYSKNGTGVNLLRELTKWADERNLVVYFSLLASAAKCKNILERNGFVEVETNYIRT